MQNKYWRNVPEEFREIWNEIYSNSRETNLPEKCPICEKQTLHRYFSSSKKGNKKDGDEWQWCSGCRHYEHMHSLVPDWWNNEPDIDANKLTAIPEVLDLAYIDLEKVSRWKAVPVEYMHKWNNIFGFNSSQINLDDKCPICNNETLHQYYSMGKIEQVKYKKVIYKGQGANWQWCSSCYHYRFIHQAYIPMDWISVLEIETWRLMPIPEPINEEIEKLKEPD